MRPFDIILHRKLGNLKELVPPTKHHDHFSGRRRPAIVINNSLHIYI